MLAEIIPAMAEQFEQEESHFSYRPSIMGPERCRRQLVYFGLGFERKPLPGRSLLVFDDSNWHEQLTLDRLRRSAYHFHSEQLHVNVPAGFAWLPQRRCTTIIDGKECGATIPFGDVSGHIDGLFTDLLGVDRLFEHKAINHFTFGKYWAGEIPWDYMVQCCCYVLGLQADVPGLREFVLLIKNKNTSAFMEFLCSYDAKDAADRLTIISRTYSTGETVEMNEVKEGILQEAFTKMMDVHMRISGKHLPKRDYTFDTWRCEYCGWVMTCYENYEAEFKELKAEGALPQEIGDTISYWKECAARRLTEEKEEKKLRAEVQRLVRASESRGGTAGPWLVEIDLEMRTTYDYSKLPRSVRESIAVTKPVEKMRVRRAKVKEAIKGRISAEEALDGLEG